MQMVGMLIGGIIWGVLGDKLGRLSTLFLTILLYSLANIANGFVQTVEQYAILRFIAGVGLAGELGVGITLVSEVMTKESRGLGTTIVSAIGIAGAVLGFLVADRFNWRVAYFVGGGLGLLLLVLRVSVYESGMFEKAKREEQIKRGDFLSLFTSAERFRKYMFCILIGIPVWYIVSQLAINAGTYAKEALNINGMVTGAKSVMLHYIGASVGSMTMGIVSEKLHSRRKALFITVGGMAVFTVIYFLSFGISASLYYGIITALGFFMGGLWAVFMTSTSEQFGTNIRATVTTTAPNFVRGTVVLVNNLVGALKPAMGLWGAGALVGALCITLSFLAVSRSQETYGKELDYVEKD
jgi:MFS family permease